MLREGIRFNIQEAQWAVLQKNDKIYQWSLKQAIQNIQRVFANDHSELPTVIRSLQTLQNITLTQKKPILEQSLLLLNQQIESKDPKTNNQPSLSTGVKPS
jgi:uroporphyrin-3 C-methyltransferase